ncbi:MAG: aldo/keto reductase [Steroidobacteraceae bacterium]
MQQNRYGRTGLKVSMLGFGTGRIGDAALDEADVSRLLNAALDLGINLIDTGRSYGLSEAHIGRHLAHRRSEFLLSTKLGYGVAGVADWTAGAVDTGVDEALKLLRTDCIDIVHLHSCDLATLQAGAVVEALLRARDAGKIRCAAYSGENAALDWAIADPRLDAIQCSVNLFDQASLDGRLQRAAQRGMGVIAKRPLGNTPWRFSQRPVGQYAELYWERMQQLAYDTLGLPWDEFALRFSAHQPEVSCAIVGTAKLEHLRHDAAIAEKGPLPAAAVAAIRQRFRTLGADWPGEI